MLFSLHITPQGVSEGLNPQVLIVDAYSEQHVPDILIDAGEFSSLKDWFPSNHNEPTEAHMYRESEMGKYLSGLQGYYWVRIRPFVLPTSVNPIVSLLD